MWYGLSIQNRSESPVLGADVHIEPTSPWFQGHFPGHPVLPGIAQLSLVLGLIQQEVNQPLSLSNVSRIRFKQLILPDDRIRIQVVPKENEAGVYTFRILKEEELISNGILTVRRSVENTTAPGIMQ